MKSKQLDIFGVAEEVLPPHVETTPSIGTGGLTPPIRSPTEQMVQEGKILTRSELSASQLALAKSLREKSIQLKHKSHPPASET